MNGEAATDAMLDEIEAHRETCGLCKRSMPCEFAEDLERRFVNACLSVSMEIHFVRDNRN